MADFEMRKHDQQSDPNLDEIFEQVAAGTQISHILHYKISEEPLNIQHASHIKKLLKGNIWNVQIIEHVPLIAGASYPVPITWTMPNAGATCVYYYTSAGALFSDHAIKVHTEQMLTRLTAFIRAQHPEFGNSWKLTHLVTKVTGAADLAGDAGLFTMHAHLAEVPGGEGGEVDEDEVEEEED